jgi:haloalkane dehalogenase
MDVLRTPDERFANLPDYPFEPHFLEVDGLRIHYVDEGPRDASPVLMMHGEPSWSFLYRKMIPLIVEAGYRAVAPDLVGFGKSDKPAAVEDYTYQRHVDWMWGWLQAVGLEKITLVGQDWGSLIGLRLVAEHPDLFDRVVLSNGGLPTGDQKMSEAFMKWLAFSERVSRLPVRRLLQTSTETTLSDEVLAAYVAPFPDETYKAGASHFASLVPISPKDPAAPANRKAWRKLMRFEKPFLTAFSDGDPITRGAEGAFQRLVPGAKGRRHITIENAGHYLQEDKGEELAGVVLSFIANSSREETGEVDRFLGTWELDPSQSNYEVREPPASGVYSIQPDEDGYLLNLAWTTAHGDGMEMAYQAIPNGKIYPYTENPAAADAISMTRVNEQRLDSASFRGGNQIAWASRILSSDGQVMTVDQSGLGPDGERYHNLSVYHRVS